ncbi:hypothetical protein AZ66_16570 [Paenibacillus sp. E194]|uniref:Phage protein n=2 Tax=Paenibacillus alvei TaxID=44250 RepID=A0ABT4E904_PAEAL|nr:MULTISPECIES: hypothetical protein [Paenibacillus]EPY11411.1 hypothetical protein PAAL66ix_18417 [Paenibacillus alvei A6-6i-x]KJB86849.1 hypothetical protein AZ66_16570 [Paenibacillus sp. E194]MCY9530207.1 hypothetical protein [Paenibacillus alvei]OBY80745.1 hypothetical protein BBG47_04620 [Paenibacillus sp. KS1]SDF65976.1 hypothetical protein SAMN04488689_106102 [Paenibacillus sp. cl6col]
MITPNEILTMIRADGFFERVFEKEGDWDAQLDARESTAFDAAWNSSYETIHKKDPTESATIRDIREYAFKQTFRLTQNSELASYVSDDLGLIAKAFDSKLANAFVSRLWNSYLQGQFPK